MLLFETYFSDMENLEEKIVMPDENWSGEVYSSVLDRIKRIYEEDAKNFNLISDGDEIILRYSDLIEDKSYYLGILLFLIDLKSTEQPEEIQEIIASLHNLINLYRVLLKKYLRYSNANYFLRFEFEIIQRLDIIQDKINTFRQSDIPELFSIVLYLTRFRRYYAISEKSMEIIFEERYQDYQEYQAWHGY